MIIVVYLGQGDVPSLVAFLCFSKPVFGGGLKLPKMRKPQKKSGAPNAIVARLSPQSASPLLPL